MTICKDVLLMPASRRGVNGICPFLIRLTSSSTELFMTGSLDRWIIRILLTEPLAVTMNVILTDDGFLYLMPARLGFQYCSRIGRAYISA